MKWAFIDYENIGGLEKIDLGQYEKIVIFLGPKQPKLNFGSVKYVTPLNITLVQIKATQANNLDFHLAYYLGKLDHEASKETGFEVISNDNGFSPLISHLKANGRVCKQVRQATLESATQKMITVLKSAGKEKRPKNVTSLSNHIATHLKIQGNQVAIRNQVNRLVNEEFIVLSGESVEYQC